MTSALNEKMLSHIKFLYIGEDGDIDGQTRGCGCCSIYQTLSIEEAIRVCDMNIEEWRERLKLLQEMQSKAADVKVSEHTRDERD